jgi:curved DNA-binding protein CbpA
MDASPRPDPYHLLGLSADASFAEIQHAFRRMLRRLHPDSRPPDIDPRAADASLQQLITAYATLRDARRRADREGRPDRRAGTRPAPAGDAAVSVIGTTSAPRSRANADPAIRVGPVRWHPPGR